MAALSVEVERIRQLCGRLSQGRAYTFIDSTTFKDSWMAFFFSHLQRVFKTRKHGLNLFCKYNRVKHGNMTINYNTGSVK